MIFKCILFTRRSSISLKSCIIISSFSISCTIKSFCSLILLFKSCIITSSHCYTCILAPSWSSIYLHSYTPIYSCYSPVLPSRGLNCYWFSRNSSCNCTRSSSSSINCTINCIIISSCSCKTSCSISKSLITMIYSYTSYSHIYFTLAPKWSNTKIN